MVAGGAGVGGGRVLLPSFSHISPYGMMSFFSSVSHVYAYRGAEMLFIFKIIIISCTVAYFRLLLKKTEISSSKSRINFEACSSE